MRRRTTKLPVLLLAVLAPAAAEAQDRSVYYIGSAASALVAVVPGFVFDVPQPDSARSFLRISSGQFDAVDDENHAIDVLLEYQPGVTWRRIKPLFGMAANSDRTFYGWVSASHDFHIAERLVIRLDTGPALYLAGEEGKKLGSAGVLRSGFEVGYRFAGERRLTASYHHMSHGKIMNRHSNPGSEVIAVNLSWPLR